LNIISRLQELVLANWTFWVKDGKLRYRAPQDGVTDDVLKELSAHRSEILRLLAQSPEIFDVCHLSYGQRSLWFIWAVAPWGAHYNQSLLLKVGGDPDGHVWREACRRLVVRHPMLRTVFPRAALGPFQQLRRGADVEWRATALTTLDEQGIQTVLAAAHGEPFDLEAAPPIRFRWFGAQSGKNLLLITMHHIVCDGWSIELIRRELPRLLPKPWSDQRADERAGQQTNRNPVSSSPRPESTVEPRPSATYFDFVRWQRAMLTGPDGARLRNFWNDQLSGGQVPTLDLPTDRIRPDLPTYEGGSCPLAIPDPLPTRLRSLAHEEGATLFAVLLAAYFAWLHQITSQDDIVVGVPTAGRNQSQFMDVVGYFVEPVAVRVQIDPDLGFRSLVRKTRETASRAIEHRDLPFALLVEHLRPAREPSRSPIFDVLFNFLSVGPVASDNENDRLDGPQGDGKFDLTLTILEHGDALDGSVSYRADLFDASTVRRFAGQFVSRLADLANDPDQPLGAIHRPAVTHENLVPIFLGRPLDDPDRLPPVHERFERHALAAPDRVAVTSGAVRLTYGQLNRLANGLARRLRDLGVGRDATVAIHAERTVEFVVALLATLKAGGGFVPLDPTHPRILLEDLARRASATVVLAPPAAESCYTNLGVPVLSLVEVCDAAASHEDRNLQVTVAPQDLAYVIYTSGSTGRPKGVAILHRALALYVSSIVRDLQFEDESSFAMVSTPAADLGYTMLFPALCTGGHLHIVPPPVSLDGQEFADYLRSHAIDYLKIVPSHLAALVASAEAPVSPRKALILGGESSSTHWIKSLQALMPECVIVNHYGPTETTIGVLTSRLEPGQEPPSPSLLLNEPVAGASIYILDETRRPVPRGSIGEVYIGGECVARGYVQDPEMTRSSFLTVPGLPFRLYKTGDLARQHEGSGLEILGRADRQIKIRGHRVDPRQIEAVLGSLRGVRQCVILPDVQGDKATRLRAFVVLNGGPHEPAELDNHARILSAQLSERLPRAMVPSEFHMLNQLPLTPNGKLDLETLARRSSRSGTSAHDSEHGSARDIVELTLCRIWREILDVRSVGPNDDFFNLGGHSLLAVRLVGQIQEAFGRRISLATLLTHSSVARLASVLRSRSGDSSPPTIVPLNRGGSAPPLLCLPGAGGSILYLQDMARLIEPDYPALGLPAPGIEPSAFIPTRIEEIAHHHIEAIRSQGLRGPYFLAGHSLGGLVAFEMARLVIARGEEVAFVGVIDNPAPDTGSTEQPVADRTHAEWLRRVAVRMEKLYGVDLRLRPHEFDVAGEDPQTVRLADRLLALGLLPPDVDQSVFVQFIKVYKANAIAAANYRPAAPPLPIPVTLFRSEEDDPALERPIAGDRAMGWGRLTTCPVNVVTIPGTHITALALPHVRVLAEKLRECLNEAHARMTQGSAPI
jgi:amino acid adenylation domain-containing protein